MADAGSGRPAARSGREIDAERRKRRRDDPGGRRALLATLTLAGLRIGEATALRWRDVNLASGKLTVGDSKTEAGRRTIDLSPDLRDELAVHRAAAAFADADDLVFSTGTGGALNRSNVRSRILLGAVQRANARIAATDSPIEPLPESISPHGLRHTYASLLFEADNTPIYVMAQIGHTDPKFTMRVYAHHMRQRTDAGKRLDAVVRGPYRAQAGAQAGNGAASEGSESDPRDEKTPR